MRGEPASDVGYLYEEVSRTGPYTRHAGNYTRYGDVLGLLTASDDRFVIFGSGDEVQLEFDPSGLPALPRGYARDYFIYADGYSKEWTFMPHTAIRSNPCLSTSCVDTRTRARLPIRRTTLICDTSWSQTGEWSPGAALPAIASLTGTDQRKSATRLYPAPLRLCASSFALYSG